MKTLDPEIIRKDAQQLEQDYTRTWSDLDQTWRDLSMESSPARRQILEGRAEALQYAARDLAVIHERALQALNQLETEQ